MHNKYRIYINVFIYAFIYSIYIFIFKDLLRL